MGLNPTDPPPTTHNDPATGQPTSVPGINAGIVTINIALIFGPGSTLGGDAHAQLLLINFLNFAPESPQNPNPQTKDAGYWARFWRCMNDYRFDNLIRDIGTSVGHPGVGEFAASLTITGTAVALVNQGLNLTGLGRYPRQGIGGPAGSPTSWQHRVGGAISRNLKMPSIGSAAKLVGRGAARVSGGLLAFEAGYETGNGIACAVIASQ